MGRIFEIGTVASANPGLYQRIEIKSKLASRMFNKNNNYII